MLLMVAERLQLSGVGLTLVPDFPVQDDWRNVSEEVPVPVPSLKLVSPENCFKLW